MKLRLRIAEAVDGDLDRSAEFLGRTNRSVADRFLSGVDDAFEMLRESPSLGAPRRFNSSSLVGLRSWRVKGFENWLIFYRVVDDVVEILRVLHGARDVEGLIEGGSVDE